MKIARHFILCAYLIVVGFVVWAVELGLETPPTREIPKILHIQRQT